MNRDEITRKTSELSTIAHTTEDSKVEYWYARELMTYMGVRQMGKTSAKLLHEPSKLATIPAYPLNPISVTLRET
mgnify:CR=1 FL=1